MSTPSDQLWAYLHSELAPEENERLEQALQNDPALRKALEECRATHNELRNALPRLNEKEMTDEQLENELLAEWENEHPEFAEAPAQKPNRNILRFTLPLAAAAALVILFSLHSDPIRWQRTAYGSAPQLRGEPAAQPYYTRAKLKQINRELQEAVETAGRPPEKWTLKIHLQELADGALEIEVAGRSAETSRVWKERFQSLENFRQKVPEFGKQIADDLAEQDRP